MSTSAACMVGDDVVVDFSFTLINTTTLTDPTTVQVIQRTPLLEELVYDFGTDPEVEKLGVGQYRFTKRIANEPRRHYFRTIGTGDVDKTEEVYVVVAESYFSEPLP